MNNIKWKWYSFKELSNFHLYELLKLRQEIFVVEQNEIFNDMDDLDQNARHLLGISDKEIISYLRLMTFNDYKSFGRVSVRKDKRNQGLGHALIKEVISYLKKNNFKGMIKIKSLGNVVNFYAKHGFEITDKHSLDNDMENVEMHLYI